MINLSTILRVCITKFLRKFFGIIIGRKPLRSVFFYENDTCFKKYALLSYRVFHIRENSKQTWSSGGDVFDIIRVLSQLGYKTDVVCSEDHKFIPERNYDLLIGHHGYNYERLSRLLPNKTVKIFYAAASYWMYHNRQEKQRLNDLFSRKGLHVIKRRSFVESDDYALKNSDGIILLGNEACKNTYPISFRNKIFNLPGASYVDKKVINNRKKNFNIAKNNFLFLSGSGNVHKGLDILLDAFRGLTHQHLYICSKLEDDFVNLYHEDLFKKENIHYIGHIQLYKKKFYELINNCAYVIFPSCSEGSPGSVADCLVQGLIPLVSKTSHITIDGFGEYIEPCTIENIRTLVERISSHDESWYRERSAYIQQQAAQRFSPELFRQKYKTYLTRIIERKI